MQLKHFNKRIKGKSKTKFQFSKWLLSAILGLMAISSHASADKCKPEKSCHNLPIGVYAGNIDILGGEEPLRTNVQHVFSRDCIYKQESTLHANLFNGFFPTGEGGTQFDGTWKRISKRHYQITYGATIMAKDIELEGFPAFPYARCLFKADVYFCKDGCTGRLEGQLVDLYEPDDFTFTRPLTPGSPITAPIVGEFKRFNP